MDKCTKNVKKAEKILRKFYEHVGEFSMYGPCLMVEAELTSELDIIDLENLSIAVVGEDSSMYDQFRLNDHLVACKTIDKRIKKEHAQEIYDLLCEARDYAKSQN